MGKGDFKDHEFKIMLSSPCLGLPGDPKPVECEVWISMASGEFDLEKITDLVTGKEVEWEMLDSDDRALIKKEGQYHVDVYCEELEQELERREREEAKDWFRGMPKEQYKWPNEYSFKGD